MALLPANSRLPATSIVIHKTVFIEFITVDQFGRVDFDFWYAETGRPVGLLEGLPLLKVTLK